MSALTYLLRPSIVLMNKAQQVHQVLLIALGSALHHGCKRTRQRVRIALDDRIQHLMVFTKLAVLHRHGFICRQEACKGLFGRQPGRRLQHFGQGRRFALRQVGIIQAKQYTP